MNTGINHNLIDYFVFRSSQTILNCWRASVKNTSSSNRAYELIDTDTAITSSAIAEQLLIDETRKVKDLVCFAHMLSEALVNPFSSLFVLVYYNYIFR